jgi:hypothetical protein
MKGTKGGSTIVLELRANEGPLLSLAMLVAASIFVVVATPEEKERATQLFANADAKVVITSFDHKLGECVAELPPRLVDGLFVNGSLLAELLKGYTSSFNEVGEVGYSPSAMVEAVERECKAVCLKCVEVYQQKMRQVIGGTIGGAALDVDALLDAHESARVIALQLYHQRLEIAFCATCSKQLIEHQRTLETQITKQFSLLRLANSRTKLLHCEQSERLCKAKVQAQYTKLGLHEAITRHEGPEGGDDDKDGLVAVLTTIRQWGKLVAGCTGGGGGPAKYQAVNELVARSMCPALDEALKLIIQSSSRSQEEKNDELELECKQQLKEKQQEVDDLTRRASSSEEQVCKLKLLQAATERAKQEEHEATLVAKEAKHSAALKAAVAAQGSSAATELESVVKKKEAKLEAALAEQQEAYTNALASKEAEKAAWSNAAAALESAAKTKESLHAEEVAELKHAHSKVVARKEAEAAAALESVVEAKGALEAVLASKEAKHSAALKAAVAAQGSSAATELESVVKKKEAKLEAALAEQQEAHRKALVSKEAEAAAWSNAAQGLGNAAKTKDAVHAEEVVKQQEIHREALARKEAEAVTAVENAVQAKEAGHKAVLAVRETKHAAELKAAVMVEGSNAAVAAAHEAALQVKEAEHTKEAAEQQEAHSEALAGKEAEAAASLERAVQAKEEAHEVVLAAKEAKHAAELKAAVEARELVVKQQEMEARPSKLVELQQREQELLLQIGEERERSATHEKKIATLREQGAICKEEWARVNSLLCERKEELHRALFVANNKLDKMYAGVGKR